MSTPAAMNALIDDIRERFEEAIVNARETAKIAPNSYGAGYNGGYADALSELFESITGDAPIPPAERAAL